jgi:predicted methyltransferase
MFAANAREDLMRKTFAIAGLAASAVLLAAMGSREETSVDRAALIEASIAAPDRPDGDRERDARRRPAASMSASPVQPGDRVLDLSAGPGYMTRLYSGLVGPEGHVTAQNGTGFAERVAPAIDQLIADRGNVDHLIAPAGELTAADGSYDVVSITLSYHDRVNNGDVEAMNQEAFRVLKSGGAYYIVDHMAPEGTGSSTTAQSHRIEGAFVRQQVEAAGFVFESESDALHNPNDDLGGARDEAGSSQFALTFRKP